MAYKSDDIQETVKAIDLGRGNELRVDTIKDKDTKELKSMDIRQWYTSDAGDKRPSKGIRIKSQNLVDVIEAVLLNLEIETIMDLESNSGIGITLPDSEDIEDSEYEDEVSE